MWLKRLFLFSVVLFFYNGAVAQNTSYEAGIHLGTVSFQTDYGEKTNFDANVTGNVGFAIGGAFYMNFFDNNFNWNNRADWVARHLKLKGDISYLHADLQHFLDSDGSAETLAMHGTSSVINLGLVTEYHFLDLAAFTSDSGSSLSPYAGLGFGIDFSKPTFVSDLGNYTNDIMILPEKYRTDDIYADSETTFSVIASIGTRIKAGETGDIVIDSRWQYFTTDKIDALQSDDASNKHNDWLYYLSVGYVLYIK